MMMTKMIFFLVKVCSCLLSATNSGSDYVNSGRFSFDPSIVEECIFCCKYYSHDGRLLRHRIGEPSAGTTRIDVGHNNRPT